MGMTVGVPKDSPVSEPNSPRDFDTVRSAGSLRSARSASETLGKTRRTC
jgi:hypothetical protein